MRVNSIFSGCLVTVAPVPMPPLNQVWEKLALTRMFRFRYQFRPTDQAWAAEAEVLGLAKLGNAPGSTSNCAYRPTIWQAPHCPRFGSKGCFGMMPLGDASSPVRSQLPEISQAVFCTLALKF